MEEQYIFEIVQMLKSADGQKFSGKEIARKIDRNSFRDDPNYLRRTLEEMVGLKLIQVDDSHHFFIETEGSKEKE